MILGLTGVKLGGKDTVADYLVSKHGFAHIRHSHILDEILNILDLTNSRRNEIDLGMSLRRTFGDGVLGKALAKRVLEVKKKSVVINGIRFQDELESAVALGAKTVYVTAPEEIRFGRYQKRQEKDDDARQTLDQFRAQEHEPTEVGIPGLGAQAEFRLDNSGTKDELFLKVDKLLTSLKDET